jgi:hypothetical protein
MGLSTEEEPVLEILSVLLTTDPKEIEKMRIILMLTNIKNQYKKNNFLLILQI